MSDEPAPILAGAKLPADDAGTRRALSMALGGLKASTRRTYAGHWARMAAHFGSEPQDFVAVFLRMTRSDAAALVQDYIEQLEREGKSVRTRATAVGAVLGMLRRWRAAGVTDLDLRELVRAPKLRHYGRRDVPTQADVRALLGCTIMAGDRDSLRDRALIMLLHDSALRRGEVASLRVRDIDAGRQAVWVLRKGRDGRVDQAVSRRAMRALAQLANGRNGDDPVFVGRTGAPMDGSAIYYVLRKRSRQAGLDPITPHQLRHACITELARRGHNIDALQPYADHADPSQTAAYMADVEGAARALAETFDED